MTTWRPIETAPKDGTWVLVWEQYINTKYHPAEVARFLSDRWVNSASRRIANASHWMPIPALPSDEPMTQDKAEDLSRRAT